LDKDLSEQEEDDEENKINNTKKMWFMISSDWLF
jgi:hypothetical protein